MTMQYVRDTYGVPVKRGMRVETQANGAGNVTKCSNYVHVRAAEDGRVRRYHPTDLVYFAHDGSQLWPEPPEEDTIPLVDYWLGMVGMIQNQSDAECIAERAFQLGLTPVLAAVAVRLVELVALLDKRHAETSLELHSAAGRADRARARWRELCYDPQVRATPLNTEDAE